MQRSIPSAARSSVHNRSLELLSNTGMVVEQQAAREMLADAGATVEDTVVLLPPDLVETAIDRAPSSFTWHGRNPARDVSIDASSDADGADSTRAITPGMGARNVLHPDGSREPATMADFERFIKLAHATETITCVGYDICSPKPYALPGDPGGFDRARVGYELLDSLIRLTDKPLVGSARSAADARASIDMAQIGYGSPDTTKPVVLARVHPRSPRRFNEPIVGGLLEFAGAGQPLVISSGAITGASAPKSLAETVILANAETLFGIVLAQIANPGTPVLYGYASTYYDPDSGALSFGGPTGGLLSAIAVDMGAHYGLPTRIDGGLTDAKILDEQSGSESALQLAGALESDADLILNGVGLLDSYDTISAEKIVLDCERIRAIRSKQRDFDSTIDRLLDPPLSLDVLRDTPPGRVFVDDRDRGNLEDPGTFRSPVAIRGRYEQWQEQGARTIVELAHDRVESRLDSYTQPPLPDEIDQHLREYVRQHDESA